MRGARAAAVITALLATAPLVAGCDDPPEHRPSPAPGAAVRVLGGGEIYLPTLEGPAAATAVDGTGLAAMAVEPDGTLWVVHANYEVFRAGPGGELVRATDDQTVTIGERGAAIVGADGDLYVAGDTNHLARLDTANPADGWRYTEILGVPERVSFTGIALSPDGSVYLGDRLTGTIYRLDERGRATASGGPPDAACDDGVAAFRVIGVAALATGEVVVADSTCDDLYRPGAPPPNRTDCPQATSDRHRGATLPDSVVRHGDRLIVSSGTCDSLWTVPVDGGGPTLLIDNGDLTVPVRPVGPVRALAVDGGGLVYLLDTEGVLAYRLPE